MNPGTSVKADVLCNWTHLLDSLLLSLCFWVWLRLQPLEGTAVFPCAQVLWLVFILCLPPWLSVFVGKDAQVFPETGKYEVTDLKC